MDYYTEKTGESFSSTAIYANRQADKKKLEGLTDLKECGSPSMLFFSKKGLLLAKGYLRVVYGDHGPYIEFLREHIDWSAWFCTRTGVGYYDKWAPATKEDVLLYYQKRDVHHLPNPPAGKDSFRGNRKEGYADYRVGRLYISPYQIILRNT